MFKTLMLLSAYYVLCFVLVPSQASAYIDPSVTTFLVQALVGLAVAVAAGFSIYWRRAKKKINQAMGKDEAAKKDESDEI